MAFSAWNANGYCAIIFVNRLTHLLSSVLPARRLLYATIWTLHLAYQS